MEFIVKNALDSMEESPDFNISGQANIKVIGCGGAGNNMVSWLYKKGIKGLKC